MLSGGNQPQISGGSSAARSALEIQEQPISGIKSALCEPHETHVRLSSLSAKQRWSLAIGFTLFMVAVISCAICFPPAMHSEQGLILYDVSTWHIVWVGGESNAKGMNLKTEYPAWPTTTRIRMYCTQEAWGCQRGALDLAKVPIYGEKNVGFSQTFANLLLKELPDDHGIILINLSVLGSSFYDGQWRVPNGSLVVASVAAVADLVANLSTNLNSSWDYRFHAMLWHGGEGDAGDNFDGYQAGYCKYLVDEMSKLLDYLRSEFKGASMGTPFIAGGLLPYWVNKRDTTVDVTSAIYSLNTSRPCTGTADSNIFSDYIPGTEIPNGDPGERSGIDKDVIHFNATGASLMGYQYFAAYKRAVMLNTVLPSERTQGCKAFQTPSDTQCIGSGEQHTKRTS